VKVDASDYVLSGSGRQRRGTLLRVRWSESVVGFADLHTWPELGQPSVEELLRVQRGELWDLALLASRREGEARARGEALPRGARQHRLWMSTWDLSVGRVLQARRDGFSTVKLKLNAEDLPGEARRLAALVGWWGDELRLRLDLNSKATPDSLARFLATLPCRMRELIDYIEDPFPFVADVWSEFSRREGVRLAWDQPLREESSQEAEARELGCVRIWKPLWESEPKPGWSRVVVTSSLGHPVGSLWAATEAVRVAPHEVHGCASHVVYDAPVGFAVNMRGDRIAELERGECGVGFTKSLASLSWRECAGGGAGVGR